MAGENNIPQTSGNELMTVGRVLVVNNEVKAQSTDGTVRVLEANGPIFFNDRIMTGLNGSISIGFGDPIEVQLDLGRESDIVINEDVYMVDGGEGPVLADVTAEIEQIQQAILEGEDVQIEDLPAPAAGPAAGPANAGGGTVYTEFTLTGDEVTPESGAETTGVGLDFLDPEVAQIEPEPEPIILAAEAPAPVVEEEPVDTVPVAGDVLRVIDEANFADGTDPNTSALTTSGTLAQLGVDFGDDLPGTLNFGGGNSIVIDSTGGDSITVTGLYGDLTVNDDGSWSYTLNDNIVHPNAGATGTDDILPDVFTFLALDEDGDSAPGSITINILDDGPIVTDGVISRVVEEEALDNYSGYTPIVGSDGNPDENDGPEDATQPDSYTVNGSLSSLINFGADNPGTFSVTSVDNLPQLYSQGGTITYVINGDTIEAWVVGESEQIFQTAAFQEIDVADTGDRLVFTLEVQSNGDYKFTLYDQLDHVAPESGSADENIALLTDGDPVTSIDFSGSITATDSDNDSTGLAPGSLSFTMVDDIPVAVEETEGIAISVLEDGLSEEFGDSGDKSEGNRESGESLTSDEDYGYFGRSIATLFDVGADETGMSFRPETESLETTGTFSITTDQDILDQLDVLYSQGEQLYYSSDGTTLRANTAEDGSGREVFTFTVNPDGSWSFDLDDQLDHVDDPGNDENWELVGSSRQDGALDLSSILVATDYDGDSATGSAEGSFLLTVQDDIPVAKVEPNAVTATVEEDDMSLSDGDFSEGINEDGSVDQDEASGVAGSLTSLFDSGSDEPLTIGLTDNFTSLGSLKSKGETVQYKVEGNVLTGYTTANTVFTLEVNGDGSWDFDLQDQLDHIEDGDTEGNILQGSATGGIDFSSALTATDYDNDTAYGAETGSFVITVEDDIPVAKVEPTAVTATVEEDDMSLSDGDFSEGINEDGSIDQDEASGVAGSLTSLFDSGSDEPLTIGLTNNFTSLGSLKSKGETVQYKVEGNVLTGYTTANTVFTLEVNGDGSWDFDLQDQLDHIEDGDTEGNVLQGSVSGGIDFSSAITATDFDSDTAYGAATGSFVITVEDDIPAAKIEPTAVTATVEEDDMSLSDGDFSEGINEDGSVDQDEASGVAGSLTSLFDSGSDEPLTIGLTDNFTSLGSLKSKGETVQYKVEGNILTGYTTANTVFTLEVNGDGSWDFDLQDQLDHIEDGDTEGNVLQGSVSGGIDFSSALTATDFDSDTEYGAATGSFVITVEDDIPAAKVEPRPVTATVEEDDMSLSDGDFSEGINEDGSVDQDEASGVAGSLTSLFDSGSDEPLTIGLTDNFTSLGGLKSKGETVQYKVEGNVLTGYTTANTVFTLEVNGDGSWDFDLQDQLDHIEDGDTEGNVLQGSVSGGIDFSSALTATDFDSDTAYGAATGSFVITVEDDIPAAKLQPTAVTATVEEDDMSLSDGDFSEGINEDGSVDQDEASGVAGSLTSLFDSGSDEPLTIGLTDNFTSLGGLKSKGETVQYKVEGNVLTGYTTANTVFTLEVNGDGSWDFDLQDQLDHIEDGDTEGNVLQGSATGGIDFSSALTATDFDSDTAYGAATGSFVITVEDDIPAAKLQPTAVTATVEEDDMSLSDGDFSEGLNEDGSVDQDEASGVAGSLTSLFDSGSDEPLTIGLTENFTSLGGLKSKGETVQYKVEGNVLTGYTTANTVFTLEVNGDGSWDFDLQDQLDHIEDGDTEGNVLQGSVSGGIDFSSALTATDFDSDTAYGAATGSFVITVEDDIPAAKVEPRPVTATVEEDDMSLSDGDFSEGINEDGSVDQDEASGVAGSLTSLFTSGSDEPLTIGLTENFTSLGGLKSKGETVQYKVEGNVLTGYTTANTVFTLEVNGDGSWDFDLQDQLDHIEDGDTEGNVLQGSVSGGIDFSSALTATDFDSDTAYGAATGSFVITVEDDIPAAKIEPNAVTATVEEDDMSLSDGDFSEGINEDGSIDQDEASGVAGSLTSLFDSGSDEPLTIGLTNNFTSLGGLKSKGETVQYKVEGNVLTGYTTANTVFTLEVNGDGSWDFDLQDQLDHIEDGDTEGNVLQGSVSGGIDFSSALTATDFDSDTAYGAATGSFVITVEDDIPAAKIEPTAVTATVEEDDMSLSDGDFSEGLNEDGSVDQDEASGVAGSLTSLFDSGSDEPLTIGLTENFTSLGGLKSKGETVQYKVEGNVLTGYTTANTVFTLEVNGDGSWDFDLQDQLDHIEDGDTEGNVLQGSVSGGIDFSSALTATDFDSDTEYGAATGSFVITVEDDIPAAKVEPRPVTATVEEDDMSLSDGDFSEGINEDGSVDQDEASGVAGSLTSLFTSGSDEPLTIGLTNNFTSLGGLKSKGETVQYKVEGNVLTGFTTANTVFTLEVNGDGSWDFDLQDQLDHIEDGDTEGNVLQGSVSGGIDFSSALTATDFDSDTAYGAATGSFVITVEDDIPAAKIEPNAVTATVEEDDMSLSDGDFSEGINEDGSVDQDEASGVAGSLTSLFDSGSDEPLTIGLTNNFTSLGSLKSKGETVQYKVEGNVLTGYTTANTVFTLEVNGDGSWDFDLQDQLDHIEDGDTEGNVLQGSVSGGIDFSSALTATDFDSDTAYGAATGSFVITVEDDIPAAKLQPTAVTATVEEDDMSLSDGDFSEGINEDGSVDQDEASGVAGSLTSLFTSGSDEPLTIGLTNNFTSLGGLKSKGETVQYKVEGNVLTGYTTANTVFTLEVNGDGSWDFDLQDQLDHIEDGDTEDNVLQGSVTGGIDFSSALTATDFDSDIAYGAATGSFVITVEDDIPAAKLQPTAVTATVEEDDMSLSDGDFSEGINEDGSVDQDEASGVAGSLTSLFTSGSDEPLTIGLTENFTSLGGLKSKGETVQYKVEGNVLTGYTTANTVFILEVNGDGSWDFDLQDQLDHIEDGDTEGNVLQGSVSGGIDFSSALTATDFDSDTAYGAATGSFVITVEDDIPAAKVEFRPVTATVEEDDMSLSDGDFSEGINEDGSVDLDEASGVAGSLTSLFESGSDEPLTVGLTNNFTSLGGLKSKGETVQYKVEGNVLTGYTTANTVFTLEVNGDGSWDFDLKDQLDHIEDGDTEGNVLQGSVSGGIDFSSALTATDFDSDTAYGAATGSFVITVEDDIPAAKLQPTAVTAIVEEDDMSLSDGDLSEGINEDGSVDQDEASGVAGSLTSLFTSGSDEPLTIGLTNDYSSLGSLKSHGEALQYNITNTADGQVLTATTSYGTVFTLEVDKDGSWDFDLQDQLDHEEDNNTEGWNLQGSGAANGGIDFSSVLTATDADSDTAYGAADDSFVISVQDDIPVAVEPTQIPQDLNLVLVLDNSGSMYTNSIDWDNQGSTTRMEALQSAVVSLLATLKNSSAANIQVHLVSFNTNASDLGTFTLKSGGVIDETAVQDATDAINGLESPYDNSVPYDEYTNYEAGFQEALAWTNGSDPLTGANVVNQVLFVSDGDPNKYNDPDLGDVGGPDADPDGSSTASADYALNQVVGDPGDTGYDGSNELAALEANGYSVRSIGIDVNSGQEGRLDLVDSLGEAINIDSADELADVLPTLVAVYDPIISATVEEDDMAYGDGDSSLGVNEDGSTDADEASGAVGSLNALFVSGADEPLTYSLTDDFSSFGDLRSHGEELEYEITNITGGQRLTASTTSYGDVFTFDVYADGSWDFDLKDQLDHVEDGNSEGNVLVGSVGGGIDLSSAIVATDADYDSVGAATGAFVITVEDDIPVITLSTKEWPVPEVQEDALATAAGDYSDGIGGGTDTAVINLTQFVDVADGADEDAELTFSITGLDSAVASTSLKSGEQTVYYHKVGDEIWATTSSTTPTATTPTVFTFAVTSAGLATFDLNDQLDHIWGSGDDEVLTIDELGQFVSATITDTDQDSSTVNLAGMIEIGVENDVPEIIGSALVDTVYEDGLSNGIGGGATEVTFALDTLVAPGADEPLSYGFVDEDDIDDPTNLFSQGDPVIYSVTGNVLTAYADGRQVFTLEVNENSGLATFNLIDQIDHYPLGSGDAYNLALNDLGGFIEATDADGDSVTFDGLLVVNINNDVPEIGTPQDSVIAIEVDNFLTADLDIVGSGADEPASITLGLTEGQAVLTTTGSAMTNSEAPLFWHDNGDGSWSAVTKNADGSLNTTAKSFTVSVDANDGTYSVNIDDGLDGGASVIHIGFAQSLNGGNEDEAVFGDVNASVYLLAKGSTDQATAFDFADGSADVNYSAQGIGVDIDGNDKGAFVEGTYTDAFGDRDSEILSFQFFSNVVYEGGDPNGNVDEANSTPLDLSQANVLIDHLGNADVVYYSLWSDGVQVSGDLSATYPGAKTTDGNSSDDFTLVIDSSQLNPGELTFDEIRFEAASTALSSKGEYTEGDYRIVSIDLEVYEDGIDQTVEVPFTITDYDGDYDTDSFSITFDGEGVIDATQADAADGDVSINGMVIAGGSDSETIIGTDYNDTIFGGAGDDVINAGGGDDTVYGEEGSDTIDGEAGNDTLDGGTEADAPVEGNDIITGGTGEDTFDSAEEAAGEVTDYSGDPAPSGVDQDDLDTLVPPPEV